MRDNGLGGAAMIAGQIALLVTMSLHPSGHDLVGAGSRFAAVAALTACVHGLAIASLPLSFLGALALTRYATAPDRLALTGLVTYGLALAAGLSAATVSGFIAPGLFRELLTAAPLERDQWRLLLDYNSRLNQAYAQIFAVAASIAVVCWSAAILRLRALSRGIAVYGLIMGPAVVIAVLPGYLPLNVHGFGLVILLQAAWFIPIGVLLYRSKGEPPQTAPAVGGS